MTPPPRLVCRNIVKEYRGSFRLGPLSLQLTSGVTCLVGPNGAGKSTFFRLVAGVERPNSGTIELSGNGERPRLGYLPQTPLFPPGATCDQFLDYVAWLQRVPRTSRREAVTDALTRVQLLEQRAKKIKDLSGGMARRLGIAHALVHRPDVVLLDEPTAGLDPRQRIGLRDTIAEIGRQRVVLVSTHLVEDVRGLADRVIVLAGGQVVYDGDVGQLEAMADAEAPGGTDLERAIATLMGNDE